MKIVMALDYYRPNVSGLSVYAERLARGLAARDHAVTVVTHRHAPASAAEETDAGVRVVRAPVTMRVGKALFSAALPGIVARELQGADVLHLHSPLVPAVPLARLARRTGAPLVVTYHCDLRLPPGLLGGLLEGGARISQNYALRRAAVIVHSTRDYAETVPAIASRIDRFVEIAPPPPSPSPGNGAGAAALRQRWGIRSAPVILFAGRFAAEKGLPDLLRAFATVKGRFPEAVLVLAGEKDRVPGESVGRELARLADDRGSGVLMPGLVAPEDMDGLFDLADVLALPSTNSTESFGMVQMEAMLRGVPAVASDIPGVRQPVLRTGMGELARPNDPASLSAALLSVLESPARYRGKAPAAQAWFSLERTIGEYEDVYRRAAGAGAGTAASDPIRYNEMSSRS
ncbi:MAG: glycosyltransferase family 4 protein [Acidobacteriota bacterium]